MAGKELFRALVKQENNMGKGDYSRNECDEEYCNCQKFKCETDDCGRATRKGDRKLFVGNLNWETSAFDLQEHFGKFGEIERVDLKTDPSSGRSRGFAFVVFKTAASVERALTDPDHIIKNTRVDPRRAWAKVGKIFVGGVPRDLSDRDIMDYFSSFGHVLEIESPYDSIKQRRMGFCFVTFDSQRPLADVLKVSDHSINGKVVEVKRYRRGVRGGGDGEGVEKGGNNWNNETQSQKPFGRGVEGFYKGAGANSDKGNKGKSYHGKGGSKWQHQESRKMKIRFRVSVELDSD